ncbi:MAG TPA: DUF2905 domain-containing protein [Humisphaera sp.]|nr:DUF2905 domain-containing protein [Humisphaera sp.]
MADLGRLLLIGGLIIALIGAVVWGLGRMGFGGLPGDIQYQSPHVRIYFPIVTCIVLSLVLTAVMWIWQWLSRK